MLTVFSNIFHTRLFVIMIFYEIKKKKIYVKLLASRYVAQVYIVFTVFISRWLRVTGIRFVKKPFRSRRSYNRILFQNAFRWLDPVPPPSPPQTFRPAGRRSVSENRNFQLKTAYNIVPSLVFGRPVPRARQQRGHNAYSCARSRVRARGSYCTRRVVIHRCVCSNAVGLGELEVEGTGKKDSSKKTKNKKKKH